MLHDFKTAQPIEFYKHFLKENVRPDGRELLKFRDALLNIGSINTARGSALVRLGHTMVICGISAELAEPKATTPDKGFFVPNVDLPPSCSNKYRPGPPSDDAQILSQFVLDVATNSEVLKLENLCIATKKLAWVIYADIQCISHDGNLKDAIIAALYAALRNTKLPTVEYNEETADVQVKQDQLFQLPIQTCPVSSTFALFQDEILLADPTNEEEEISNGTITIVVNSEGKLCMVSKPGGAEMKEEKLKVCIRTALKRHAEVMSLVTTALCEDEPVR